jgi:hypothetical protein
MRAATLAINHDLTQNPSCGSSGDPSLGTCNGSRKLAKRRIKKKTVKRNASPIITPLATLTLLRVTRAEFELDSGTFMLEISGKWLGEKSLRLAFRLSRCSRSYWRLRSGSL